jgi:CRP-like cAMP-binding protein
LFVKEIFMEQIEFPAGAVIVMVGDPATQAYLIRRGKVELRRGTGDSQDHESQLGPGQVFGELGLIGGRPSAMSARAITDVHVSVMTQSEFETLLSEVPEDYAAFLNALFGRLKSTHSDPTPAISTALATVDHLTVTLHPLTRRAAATLPREGLTIEKYPFRIGRAAAENEAIPKDLNDLWLSDQLPFNVSRNHAVIERNGNDIIVKDRGSSLGMFVNESQIGGRSRERQVHLEEGDNIVVLGGPMSPYQFRINLSRG